MIRRTGRGFSLLEVMIAVIVLAIALIAVTRSADQSRRSIGEAATRSIAQLVASDRAAELQLTGAAGAGRLSRSVTMGRVDWTVDTRAEETASGLVRMTIHVSAPGGPGALLVAYVRKEAAR